MFPHKTSFYVVNGGAVLTWLFVDIRMPPWSRKVVIKCIFLQWHSVSQSVLRMGKLQHRHFSGNGQVGTMSHFPVFLCFLIHNLQSRGSQDPENWSQDEVSRGSSREASQKKTFAREKGALLVDLVQQSKLPCSDVQYHKQSDPVFTAVRRS